jgi:putative hemolysin
MDSMDKSINSIFRLSVSSSDPLRRRIAMLLKDRIEGALMLSRLNAVYGEIVEKDDVKGFVDESLEKLGIAYEAREEDIWMVPKTGAFLVVANHPFGGVEGLILCALLLKVRTDVRIMANYLLERIPQLRPVLLCVDPFGAREAVRKNLKPLKEAMGWLKGGHSLVVFPAGEVSHFDVRERRVVDPKWHYTVARIARATQAPVLPVFFDGANSPLFQVAGMVHPRLRTALLPRELLNKAGKTIKVRIGSPIPSSRIGTFENDEKLVTYLRMRTYALKHRRSTAEGRRPPMMFTGRAERFQESIVEQPDNAVITREVINLPVDQLLVRSREYAVYHAKAHQIPNLLFEIGRLREITFRRAGEGTGKSLDLDRFDLFYSHLFVWNTEKCELVGAYRLGVVDHILRRFGKNGLYTSTLFNYREPLLEHLRSGIELGRSFVREEYQRLYSSLLLLWKGITRFVVRNPGCTILFGPVTISDSYSPISRELMVSYLTVNHYAPDLARLIKPRRPPRGSLLRRLGLEDGVSMPSDLDDLSSLISDIEADRKDIPVLLKQYVRLGGKLMGFNLDPSFANGLDGLILIDLLKCDRKVLDRYMGKDEADVFFGFHQCTERDLAS